jgi:hypothetical protein
MSDTGGFPLVGGSPAFPGKNNVVRDSSGSNSFGWENLNVGNLSVVGGYRNKVAKDYSFIFGLLNSSSALYSFIGGQSNTVSNSFSSAFGQSNTVSGGTSVAIGFGNTVAGSFSGSIGQSHTVNGSFAFTAGSVNTISNSFGTAFGSRNTNSRYGELSHSSGLISAVGDAQHGWLIFRNQSTSATPVVLYLDGSSANERAVLAAGARWKCTLEIIATTTGAINKSASWEYKFQIDRPTTAATTIIRTTPLLTLSDGSNAGAPPAGWSVAITADTTNGCPQIQVTGDTDTINWTAALHYVQSIRV